MLGQSAILIGPLIAAGLSIAALRAAPDRTFAIIAMAVSAVEVLGLIFVFALS